jgi:hypothetical protein
MYFFNIVFRIIDSFTNIEQILPKLTQIVFHFTRKQQKFKC